MSGGKGGKRISVFDRLGPGNDEVSTYMCFEWLELWGYTLCTMTSLD